MRYFLLHKPRGCISSTVDDTGRGRPTVYDVAKAAGVPNFGPVGRLDFDTSGALLFTDDYKLKRAISSPTYKGKAAVGTVPSMEKVYHLLVAGTVKPDDEGMHLLREPLYFGRKQDGPGGCWTKPAEARVLLTKTFVKGQPVPWRFKPGTIATITWIEVFAVHPEVQPFSGTESPAATARLPNKADEGVDDDVLSAFAGQVLREGKNRQIRRLCGRSEFELTRLHRVSVGPVVLGDLEEGCCRELTRKEVQALYKRCLPEDPLCPTVADVKDILTRRLALAARRARQASGLASCHSDTNANKRYPTPTMPPEVSTCETRDRHPGTKAEDGGTAGGAGEDDGLALRKEGRSKICAANTAADDEDLTVVVQLLIDLARRDLHETPPGAAGEPAGPDYCPGEEQSLAQARAIPPNEKHMECGYRCSQIERLGLTYDVM